MTREMLVKREGRRASNLQDNRHPAKEKVAGQDALGNSAGMHCIF